jgi:F0F1-type ATP synthase assembly protein I
MEWVARITAVGMEMVLPTVAGFYLDRYLQTGYWTLVGLIVGGVAGFWHLLQMTKALQSKRRPSSGKDSEGGSAGE